MPARPSLAYFVDGRMPTEKANGYQSAQMCQAFGEAGCDVTLLSPTRRRLPGEEVPADATLESYYQLRAPLAWERLKAIDFIYLAEIVLKLPEGSLPTKLASVATSYGGALALARYLRRRQPELIYLRSPHALQLLVGLVPEATLPRVFFELHLLPTYAPTRKRLLEALARIGGVVTVTGALRQTLIDEGVAAERVLAEHDAVDLASFDIGADRAAARARLGIAHAGPIASFVGKFHTNGQEKGIPEILQAAQHLVEPFPELRFYFVGGPLERAPAYERQIAELGLPRERFLFMGKQPVQDVPWYLAASDVLLMPHPWSQFYAYEVSPLKLFEYMSAARPIVASALPSIMEVLRDRENALLGPAGDAGAIAANVRAALEDPALAARVAARAREDVAGYTWDKRAERILAFMQRQLAHQADHA